MKRCLVLLVVLLAARHLLAYEPNSTSPYTFNGTYTCSSCETFSHEKVGDGFHHDSGCEQSGSPLYWCDCSIGYTGSQMLAQPILRVIDDHTVELEYFARNIYCNPPADFGPSNEPNAISYRIQVIAIDPQTMATTGIVHTIPPYWEHGKIVMTDMNPGCTMYRAVYTADTFFTTYAVSSDVVGGTGSSSCAPITDMGSCPMPGSGSGPSGGVSPAVGGPINVGSGNMYWTQPLFGVDEPGNSLEFSITYNSLETRVGPLGPGFTHSFAESMQSTSGTSNVRLWRRPDGTRVLFARENHPPVGEYWRPIYPGDTTGSVGLNTSTGRYRWTELNGTFTEVDSTNGLWRTTEDRWGNAFTASYTGTNLTTLTDELGRTWTFAYSGSLLTSITDGDGNQWRFEYDGSNRLEKIFDPLHTSTTPWRQFTWTTYATGKSAVALIADDSGAILEGHQYDSSGRSTSSWSGHTITGSAPSPGTNARDLVTLSYDSPTQTTVTTTIDSGVTQNSVYTLKVGSGRFLATSVLGNCASCGSAEEAQAFTFDDNNRVLTKTVGLDRTGSGGTDERVTSSFTYNANGMLLTATEAVGKTEQHTTTYAYGQTNWPSFVTSVTEASVAKSAQSRTTTYAWNTGETLLTTTQAGYLRSTDSSPTSYVHTTTFDARHRVTENGGPRTNQKTTYSYYSDSDTNLNRRGRLYQTSAYSTTSASLTTTFDNYDIYGTARSTIDPNGVETTRTLDARGRTLTVRSEQPSDPNEPADYVTTHVYDSRDRLVSTTLPRGNIVRYTYEDGTNRGLSTIRAESGGNERDRMLFTLNTIGLKTSEAAQECTTPANPCTTWTTRRSETFAYDTSGRLSTNTHPDSTFVAYTYDSRGNLTGVRDERHSSANTLNAYDFRNRLTSVTQKRTIISGSDIVTQYAYDDADNLVSVTDPKSSVTTYAYDDFGRMQTQTSPVTGTTSYTYDASGNNTSTTDANSATTTRTFDLLNRVLTASSSRTSLPTEDVTWTYDDATAGDYGIGRLSSMTDPYATTTYKYERRGLLREDSTSGAYTYDANGNRTTQGIAEYIFDYADRPVSAEWSGATLFENVEYLPFGPLEQLEYGNGAVKTVTYDSRYRPTENKLVLSSTTIADYDYTYDGAGNITAIDDDLNANYDRDFTYDDLNRLVTADTGTALWGSGTYAYDVAGNMTSLSLGSSRNVTFTYSGTTSKLSTVNSASVSYDSAGNEQANISARNLVSFDAAHYVYDGRGVRRSEYLSPWETSSPYSQDSFYTPELQLLGYTRSAIRDSTTDLVWLGSLPVGQLSSDDYALSPSQTGMILDGDTTNYRYTFTDHLGTPLLQMIGNSVAWRAEYEPFGRVYAYRAGNDIDQRLRLPGQEQVTDTDGTEQVYNIFRWYRTGWGRYTQADPLGQWDGPNLHAYVKGRPTTRADRLGLAAGFDPAMRSIGPTGDVLSHWADRFRDDLQQRRGDGHRRFPGEPNSAMRHCTISCETADVWGRPLARMAGAVNEAQGLVRWDIPNIFNRLSGATQWAFQPGDFGHNERGFRCLSSVRSGACRSCEECCAENCCGSGR
ncbi:MAG TPA: RHS repeat-associated core domain-containing protein [Thermoanaerobaculia bacterium]